MKTRTKYMTAEERRSTTVQAVIALAAQKNPSEITTMALAKKMRVTQGALFKHFPTKDAIFKAVMQWVAEHFVARLEKPAREATSALAALEAVFLEHARFVVEHPGVPRMIFAELQRGEKSSSKAIVESLLQRYRALLQRLIEQGKARKEIPETLDTAAAITMFIGMIQGLVMQSLLAGDVARVGRDALKVFAIYQRGIRRKP